MQGHLKFFSGGSVIIWNKKNEKLKEIKMERFENYNTIYIIKKKVLLLA